MLIPVVAAALIRSDGRVLLQRRRLSSAHGGLWEFPGGKVQLDETPEAALVRELHEELGISVAPDAFTPVSFASDPAQPPQSREPYLILLYACKAWRGEPRCLVGEKLAWFELTALAQLDMPPLDVPLAKALHRAI